MNPRRKRKRRLVAAPADPSAISLSQWEECVSFGQGENEPTSRRSELASLALGIPMIPISARRRRLVQDHSRRVSSGPGRTRRRRRALAMPSYGTAALLLLGSSVHLPGGGAVIVRAEEVGEFGRPQNGEEENSKATPKPKSALAPGDSGGSPPSIGSIDQKTPVISPDLGREPKTGDGADADDSKQNHDFLWWCNHVMGIKMPHVEIRSFTYPDYLSERAVWNDYHAQLATARAIQSVLGASNDIIEVTPPDIEAIPTLQVRGLAATHPISPGETIISIPLNAMISVQTTIDHDPVLSTVLGPAQRSKYGWDGANAPYYEVPLLIVAVLYHAHVLGDQSPLLKYIDTMRDTPLQSIPLLLDDVQLRQRALPDGVMNVIGEVQEDMRDMYATVVGTLVREFPDVFGPPKSEQGDNLGDWAFSFDKFCWAFAIVNSRHWNVPVLDLDEAREAVMRSVSSALSSSGAAMSAPAITSNESGVSQITETERVDLPPHEGASEQLSSIGVNGIETPPAAQPTDAFVEQQVAGTGTAENSRESNERSESSEDDVGGSKVGAKFDALGAATKIVPRSHSFMAPLADLLNFGPPCTRGSYDAATHTFNVVATCSFEPGQEITFYYSGDCEDIIYGNYGFVHPMIPACPTSADMKKEVESWMAKSQELNTALVAAYEDMDTMEADIDNLADRLEACGCQEDIIPGVTDEVIGQSDVTQPPTIANALGQDGMPPQAPSRRTIADNANALHKELRGSAHAAAQARGEVAVEDEGGDVSTESHGGVSRLWRRISNAGRNIRDIEDSL